VIERIALGEEVGERQRAVVIAGEERRDEAPRIGSRNEKRAAPGEDRRRGGDHEGASVSGEATRRGDPCLVFHRNPVNPVPGRVKRP
jgi:hypothetical protein